MNSSSVALQESTQMLALFHRRRYADTQHVMMLDQVAIVDEQAMKRLQLL